MEKTFTQTAFRQYLAEEKLMGSECGNCGRQYLPPRPMCPECFNGQMVWAEMETTGILAAFTIVNIASTTMIEAGYGRDNPHCSGIVTLDNGLSISAQILGVDTSDPGSIMIGTQVKAVFVTRSEEEGAEKFLAFKVVG
jgi:uncharacterized OB-fold protein